MKITKKWDVFISYKNDPDLQAARDLLAALENAGLQCWIAFRDLKPGKRWDDEIPDVIQKSRSLAVLVSESAQSSKYMKDEMAISRDHDIPLFPIRLDSAPLKNAFLMHLKNSQWCDCQSGSGTERFEVAAFSVKSLIENETSDDYSTESVANFKRNDWPSPTREDPGKAEPQPAVNEYLEDCEECEADDHDSDASFYDPDYYELANLTASEVLDHEDSSYLIERIAELADRTPQTVRKHLKAARANQPVRDVVRTYERVLDIDLLSVMNIKEARDLRLASVLTAVLKLKDPAAAGEVLEQTHGRTLLRKAFSAQWPD